MLAGRPSLWSAISRKSRHSWALLGRLWRSYMETIKIRKFLLSACPGRTGGIFSPRRKLWSMCMSAYQRTKRWRDKNPGKVEEYRQRYFNRVPTQALVNEGKTWSKKEIKEIMASDRPADVELSRRLGRSLRAIQIRRFKENIRSKRLP